MSSSLSHGEAGSPRVAVVVPSFQQARFLPRSLESLARQQYPGLETAVFDNVSTDGSDEVLRRFEGRLTRIVRARDGGQAQALSTAFSETDADVLGWLNADDMLLPDTVARIAAVFRDDPDVDVVYGHCAFLSAEGQFLDYFHDIQEFSRRDLLNFSDFVPQPATFFRRSAYEAAGGIDASLAYAMDWDLWCRLARQGSRFRFLNEVLAAARLHPDTKTATGGWARSREVWTVNRRHASYGIPFLAVAQLYHQYVRRHVGSLAALPRWAWSGVLQAPRSNAAVLGVGPGRRVGPGPFRVRFPVHAPVRRVRLSWTDAARFEVALGDGLSGSHTSGEPGSWVWRAQAAAEMGEIDIRGEPSPGRDTVITVAWE